MTDLNSIDSSIKPFSQEKPVKQPSKGKGLERINKVASGILNGTNSQETAKASRSQFEPSDTTNPIAKLISSIIASVKRNMLNPRDKQILKIDIPRLNDIIKIIDNRDIDTQQQAALLKKGIEECNKLINDDPDAKIYNPSERAQKGLVANKGLRSELESIRAQLIKIQETIRKRSENNLEDTANIPLIEREETPNPSELSNSSEEIEDITAHTDKIFEEYDQGKLQELEEFYKNFSNSPYDLSRLQSLSPDQRNTLIQEHLKQDDVGLPELHKQLQIIESLQKLDLDIDLDFELKVYQEVKKNEVINKK
jgi:hypothetical protein